MPVADLAARCIGEEGRPGGDWPLVAKININQSIGEACLIDQFEGTCPDGGMVFGGLDPQAMVHRVLAEPRRQSHANPVATAGAQKIHQGIMNAHIDRVLRAPVVLRPDWNQPVFGMRVDRQQVGIRVDPDAIVPAFHKGGESDIPVLESGTRPTSLQPREIPHRYGTWRLGRGQTHVDGPFFVMSAGKSICREALDIG